MTDQRWGVAHLQWDDGFGDGDSCGSPLSYATKEEAEARAQKMTAEDWPRERWWVAPFNESGPPSLPQPVGAQSTTAAPHKVALAEHEDMWRWKRLPVWAQQELQHWRVDEAHQRGRAEAAEAALLRIAKGECDSFAGDPSKWPSTVAALALGWVSDEPGGANSSR